MTTMTMVRGKPITITEINRLVERFHVEANSPATDLVIVRERIKLLQGPLFDGKDTSGQILSR